MLEKIVQIKCIGRFQDYSASGDVTFRKMTLVYAENGRGKTTLCAILRSLQTGKPEFIAERKTLGIADAASAHLRVSSTSYTFADGAWTAPYPQLAIFDSVFVTENVCSGEVVDHDHKKNLYRVIVGSEGVRLAKEIEQLDGQIRDANSDLRTKREVLAKGVPAGVTVEEYLGWQPIADIDDQAVVKTEELRKRENAIARSGEIQAKGLLAKVQLPSLPGDFSAVLAKQIADIVADAEARVRNQIAHHGMGQQGESWLAQGVGFVRDQTCPFCSQGVRENQLLGAYRSHFNAAYRTLKQEVAQLKQRINSAVGESPLITCQRTISGNETLVEFWKQFVNADLPELSFQAVQQKYAALREQSLILAQKKQDHPTELVPLDAAFSSALAEVESLRPAVTTYNTAVDAINTRVQAEKLAARDQAGIATIKAELAQLEARKRRFEPEAVQSCAAYSQAVAAKAALDQTKETTRQRLDQHCGNVIQAYQISINDYLDQFNAGFRITNSRHLYTGGTPSSHYQIEINGTALELGDENTPPGTPCFKTSLSSGDRSSLAFAFFLAMLKQDAEINQKTIVLDDPFTSLDRFRRTCTQQLILRLGDSAKQIVVLSHDPLFLKLIFDEHPTAAADIRTLQMSKSRESTVIGEWDVQAEAQSSYMKDYATLLAYYRERKGDRRGVARTIRPFLEGLFRVHFPGQFAPNEWLGDFIGKIRAAGPADGLHQAKSDLAELEDINGYSKKYHHQQNVNADTEPINDDELHGFVKRTLRLVGGT
jgi:wobble nucleotide-excising tRNase